MFSPSTVQYKVMLVWDTNNLNDIADGDNVKLMTKKINGGSIGLKIDRNDTSTMKVLECLSRYMKRTMMMKMIS